MAKTYLNKEEKQFVLVLSAFTTFLADNIEKLKGLKGVPVGAVTGLKTSRTHAQKVLRAYMAGLDRFETAKLVAENKKMTVAARYTNEAVDEYRQMLELDTVTPMKTDDFLDLVGQLIENTCKQCHLKGDLVDTCIVRQLFITYDVEPYNLEAEAGTCCYQYND